MFRLFTAFVAVFLCVSSASAQSLCFDRAAAVKHIADKYQEKQTGAGVAANGHILELFSSESGAWTIMLTRPEGVSCVMASGESWVAVDRPKGAGS